MNRVLALKPTTLGFGRDDPSAVLFENGEPVFGVEEERLIRVKHASNHFPEQSIRACFESRNITFDDVDEILLPNDTRNFWKQFRNNPHRILTNPSYFRWRSGPLTTETDKGTRSVLSNAAGVLDFAGISIDAQSDKLAGIVKEYLSENFSGTIPPITKYPHHACHAASAYYPADFEEGVIITMDAIGDHDSTVVWRAADGRLSRERTYADPNSLGWFFMTVCEFLGYQGNDGEGKIMGLAPYGDRRAEIDRALYSAISAGVDYDVTELISGQMDLDINRFKDLFGRDRKIEPDSFGDWEKDLAFSVQKFLEKTVTDIVATYCQKFGTSNVGLAGGVAMNCKMNKQVMELDAVDNLYVTPLAHDGGLALGAGLLNSEKSIDMPTVYFGPSYSNDKIESLLETNKISYQEPSDLKKRVAESIADGNLVGWFQDRLEMGPRALGNRSILADPRSLKSRDHVNRRVKHREEWRPFAPTILEEAADEYLENAERSPFMIKTFDATEKAKTEIPAVLHPNDSTTRPQTVNDEQNPRYTRLIREFENITDVPVLLNTSFNDSGEPIVNRPQEALKDFYGMGLDVLVLGDFLVTKE